jgi:hypothetical protein
MAKQPKEHQVMRHSGEDGKTSAGTKFLTGWGAQSARARVKAEIPEGSSDWVTVDRTRRKGRGNK